MISLRRISVFGWVWLLILLSVGRETSLVAVENVAANCLAVEVYTDGQPAQTAVVQAVERFAAARPGLQARILDVAARPEDRKRLASICTFFKIKETTPLLYTCGGIAAQPADAKAVDRELNRLTTMTVYTRAGCPHCAAARAWLPQFQARFSGLRVRVLDIVSDAAANNELQALVRARGVAAASVPVFDVCQQTIVGFVSAQVTGPRVEAAAQRWAVPCAAALKPLSVIPPAGTSDLAWLTLPPQLSLVLFQPPPADAPASVPSDSLPLPDALTTNTPPESQPETIDLPWFGTVDARSVGLPLFTVAVGLIDGFNPCAMWVLIFLLSVLVNLHSRAKMAAVAGTFVFISGAAYYAFMAAWLNVFLFIGMLTWIRITLAILALTAGAVHVKDYFAFKQGVSLSIPESTKPRIYDRVRRIVSAENLWGAIIGASILAVLVNIVELLCTAGLPAIYTQVLAAHRLPSWQYYGYLLLYIAAYMGDDAIMVTIAVITLSRGRLQETAGRRLKLVSGLVILALGIVMLVKPQWLGLSW